jgi:hypothetical protein
MNDDELLPAERCRQFFYDGESDTGVTQCEGDALLGASFCDIHNLVEWAEWGE